MIASQFNRIFVLFNILEVFVIFYFYNQSKKMVKVAVIGATGKSGSSIVKELLNRGHSVVAIVRDASKAPQHADVTVRVSSDVETDNLVPLIKDADVVVHAYAPPVSEPNRIIGFTDRLVQAVHQSNQRLVMVGGAGGLKVAGGILRDASFFPKEYIPIAQAHIDALEVLRKSNVNWTTLSPPAYFFVGERKGTYRKATEDLVSDANGNSSISYDDYAIALVDEIEKPVHVRQRFTCGY
jgi:putative NADH-flavin reductase